MGALGAAISGLQSSQKWLDVISNNVSNSQTVAYKMGRLSFADLISDGLRSPSGPNNNSNLGGINPSQVGLGVTVGTVQTIMKQGALTITGNVTDVAINGTGLLTVSKGAETLYTRAGNLTFDQQGNLVTSDGGLVQGWMVSTTRNPAAPGPMTIISTTLDTTNPSAIGNISIPNNLVLGPKATSLQLNPAVKEEGVIIKGNLDNRTPQNPLTGYGPAAAPNAFIPDATTTFVVYDSLGTAYTMLMAFWQTANTAGGLQASWDWSLHDITGGVLPNSDAWAAGGPGNQVATGAGIQFNPDGSLMTNGVAAGTNIQVTIAPGNGAVNPFNFSINLGTPNIAAPASYGLRDGLTGDYGNGSFDSFGVYTPVQTVYTADTDGYSEGTLMGLSFNQTGGVDCSFSNGENVEVAKLALTKFDNQDGLTRVGGNYFARTANSGLGQIGVAGANGFGTVSGGTLEASNVDLTIELTNMILAQRMFESNARVVTTADNVLDTLVNLGR